MGVHIFILNAFCRIFKAKIFLTRIQDNFSYNGIIISPVT
jgi:hypothetical protein